MVAGFRDAAGSRRRMVSRAPIARSSSAQPAQQRSLRPSRPRGFRTIRRAGVAITDGEPISHNAHLAPHRETSDQPIVRMSRGGLWESRSVSGWQRSMRSVRMLEVVSFRPNPINRREASGQARQNASARGLRRARAREGLHSAAQARLAADRSRGQAQRTDLSFPGRCRGWRSARNEAGPIYMHAEIRPCARHPHRRRYQFVAVGVVTGLGREMNDEAAGNVQHAHTAGFDGCGGLDI